MINITGYTTVVEKYVFNLFFSIFVGAPQKNNSCQHHWIVTADKAMSQLIVTINKNISEMIFPDSLLVLRYFSSFEMLETINMVYVYKFLPLWKW